MKAKDLASYPVVTLERHETILSASRKMREFHVGVIVIIRKGEEGDIPIGILTDRDIVIEAVSRDLPAISTLVSDLMSDDPVCAHENDEIHTVFSLMKENGIRRIPLVDEQYHLKGIISLDDLLGVKSLQDIEFSSLPRLQRNWEREARSSIES